MKKRHQLGILSLAVLQAACGGGGGNGSSGGVSPAAATATISGTVPGTLIQAFGDNGSYYEVESTHNGTARHPFQLDVPPGVGIHLVMVTGKGTPDEVITPIGFRDSSGNIRTRLALGNGDAIELGHVPLPMGRNSAAADDLDNDGVLDRPMVLDDVGAQNPLSQSDADKDGVDDWNDVDHGGYQYDDSTKDPQDADGDGIPNVYDHDHATRTGDSDNDGLPDNVDANPHNDPDYPNDGLNEDCDRDGYNDDDHNHDGFHDDDIDRDGRHDGEQDIEESVDTGHCGTPPTQNPAPAPAPAPAPTPVGSFDAGQAEYDARCASCHAAGTHDTSGPFPDLAGKGGRLQTDLGNISGGMSGIILTDQDILDLRAFLDDPSIL